MRRVADVLVIGGGPAGLSAALFLTRIRRSVLLYDSKKYRNRVASEMHAVPGGYDAGLPPSAYLEATRKDLKKYEEDGTLNFVWSEVTHIEATSPPESADATTSKTWFTGKDVDGNEWGAKKVVLATGVEDAMPQIPGFAELWGDSIFHCIYCHGFEQRDKPLGVLLHGRPDDFPMPGINTMIIKLVASKFAKLNSDITLFTNGLPTSTPDDFKAAGIDPDFLELFKSQATRDPTGNIRRQVINNPISSIAKTPDNTGGLVVKFENDDQGLGPVKIHAIQHIPLSRPSSINLLYQLGLDKEVSPMGELARVGTSTKTKVPGVFAVGNLITFKTNVPISVVSGGDAALEIGEEMDADDIATGLLLLKQSSG